MPVRDVASTVDEQLIALAGQTFAQPWELIVADNGSRDATRSRLEAFRDRLGDALPIVRLVDASTRRGVAHARNVGLRVARGDVLLICDGDDIVAPDWLEHMVGALDEHPIVTGFIDLVTLNDPVTYEWMGDTAREDVPIAYGHRPYAPGGNIGMWRDVFDLLGGFDENLKRAEDIDFSWRAAELGIGVHCVPDAVLHRRIRTTLLATFKAGLRGGIAEPRLFRRHRMTGMKAAPIAQVRAEYRWLFRQVPHVVAGRADRYQWAHHAGKRLGRISGSARAGVMYL
jgi:glycosyltransferase involved in cell wall biosynthesis